MTLLPKGLDAAKIALKKIVNKTAESTEELMRNNIPEKIAKLKSISDAKSTEVEKLVLKVVVYGCSNVAKLLEK